MKERTADNVHKAFVGEAKVRERLLMFALGARAIQIGKPHGPEA